MKSINYNALFVIQLCYLIASLALSEAGCPSRCMCSTSNVTCAGKYITSVPNFETLQEDPKLIDLSGNDIEFIEITDFSFDKNVEVQYLYLNSNSILDVDANSFVELKNLQTLSISNNLLEDLPSDVISNNSKLNLLDLSNNMFGRNPPKLMSSSLEILDLSFSKIEVFNDSNLNGIPNLKVLFLQDNNLQFLSPLIFGVTKDFFYINVAINTWKCNCKTIELFDFLTKHQLTEIESPVTCVSQNKSYIQIYTANGPLQEIKTKCSSNNGSIENDFELANQANKLSAQNEMLLMEQTSNKKYEDIINIEQLLDLSENKQENNKAKSVRNDEISETDDVSRLLNSRIKSEVSFVKEVLTFYFVALCSLFALTIGIIIGVIVTNVKHTYNAIHANTLVPTSLDNMPYTLIVSK